MVVYCAINVWYFGHMSSWVLHRPCSIGGLSSDSCRSVGCTCARAVTDNERTRLSTALIDNLIITLISIRTYKAFIPKTRAAIPILLPNLRIWQLLPVSVNFFLLVWPSIHCPIYIVYSIYIKLKLYVFPFSFLGKSNRCYIVLW